MPKPIIIYISGAPGSGKTTLAKRLSEQLYIPHVSSDLVHGGASLTIGKPNNRHDTLLNGFVPLMQRYSDLGISFVVDQVLLRGVSEEQIIAQISDIAQIIYIHLETEDPIKRHLSREQSRSDDGKVLSPDDLIKRAQYHEGNLKISQNALDLHVPTLIVKTDNGYDPGFEQIVEFIVSNCDNTKLNS